jgi:23S rRNA (cytidine1920-2'-O)/16S rRNA (cytidine1409-2'-O)-methyltransferase
MSRKNKERLDVLLVERGLAPTRSKAQALIMAGEVLVGEHQADKPGTKLPVDADIALVEPLPYVGRGGYKLAEALDAFGIDVTGRICADVGASTGGFTDVLLQRGAKRVYAIDVGYGQLAWKLRNHPQVIVMERTNARYLTELEEPVSFVSIDVSFISLKLILPVVRQWLAMDRETGPDIVALIKPQFEAGRQQVGKVGVVKEPAVHRAVLADILVWAAQLGLPPAGLIHSPIRGPSGNIEFLAWFRPGADLNFAVEATIDDLVPAPIRPED